MGRAGFALRQKVRQVAAACLENVFVGGEVLESRVVQTYLNFTVHQGDSRGRRALVTDDFFERARGLSVLRVGHPVGNEGGLEGDHGFTLMKRRCDLIAEL